MVVPKKTTNSKNIESIYPLSPIQQGMLFHTLYAPNSGVYFEQFSLTLRGNLDIFAFKRAWQQVVDRHSILRTLFVWENRQQPLQVVLKQVDLPWKNYDWRKLSPIEQQQHHKELLQKEREQGFQLDKAPLMQCTLIDLEDEIYKFIWSNHHILIDGWSLSIIFKEVLTFYEAQTQGRIYHLAQPHPYRDYIVWLQQQDISEAQEFWQKTLAGFVAPTPLVVDLPEHQQSQTNSIYHKQEINLSNQVSQTLQSLAKQHRLTLSTLVQAAWALLISSYSGEKDVVFGVTVSGRPANLSDVENMVGLFINTLPLRVQVPPKSQVLLWLEQLQQLMLELQEHSHTSLVDIQELSEIPGGMSLFESIVVFENYPIDSSLQQTNGSLQISDIEIVEQTNYPLTLIATSDEKLAIKIIYDTGRFEADTVKRMLGHLQTILAAMVKNPQQRVGKLPLLTKAERHQLLIEWNDTATEYPTDKCIHQLFEEQVKKTPDAVAVAFNTEQLTYYQLNQRANQLAHYLQSLGVRPEVLVGICVERSVEMLVGLLGILKAGGAYVPLDPNYPAERLNYMLADSGVKVLLTQQSLLEFLPENQAQIVCLDTQWQLIAAESDTNLEPEVQPDNLLYVIYTSGSTGLPKGVALSHRALTNLIEWHLATMAVGVGVLQFASLSFDASFHEMFAAWCSGGKLFLIPENYRLDLDKLVHFLAENPIQKATLPVVLWQQLAEAYQDQPQLFANLTEAIATGEQLQITQQMIDLFSRLDHCTLHNHYGPSETHVVTSYVFTEPPQKWPICPPIGKPIANIQIYILDEHLQLVPVGVSGELYIGGNGLARGYLKRPELTSKKFISNPFDKSKLKSASPALRFPQRKDGARSQNSKLYKTGDLARYLPDGNIEFLGRIDHQVKIRGFRIELGEIEAVLNNHPQIQQAVVIATEDIPSNKRLVAYVVTSDKSLTTNQLREFLFSNLPEYMVPSAFVTLDTLPLTPNGKIDRFALPAPDKEITRENEYVAPRTQSEEIIANIFANVLDVQNVGINDNFFELGGHSLFATQVTSRIKKIFQVELPLRLLFESSTVAGLAKAIQDAKKAELKRKLPPIERVSRNGKLPLSFAQGRLWFLNQLEPDSLAYNLPAAFQLIGYLNVAALEQSFNEIVRRHEILHTTFSVVEGQPIQRIALSLDISLPVVNLCQLPEAEQKREVQRLVKEWSQRLFDLAQEPLLRIMLLQLNEQEYFLLFSTHHIISDGWSIGVFIRELATLYGAFSHGKSSPLPELAIQYADFTVWQQQWLQGEVLESQLAYWKQHLGANPPVLELPTNQLRSSVSTSHGKHQFFALSQILTEKIKTLSKQEGVTLFMTLLGAFKTLLHSYKGQEDILVGSPIANRNRNETEGLIGFFVNTLVLRTDLSDNPSFREVLGRVREVTLEAYAHQDLPFDKLVTELNLKGNLNNNPLFRIWFVLQNAPMPALELPGLTLNVIEVETGVARYDLKLDLTETPDGLKGLFEYKTDLFEASTIAQMAQLFELVLSTVVQQPDIQLSALVKVLEEAQKQQQLSQKKEFQESRRQKLSELRHRAIKRCLKSS